MNYPFIFYARMAIALTALGCASYQDVKRREVDDSVWLFSVPATLFLSVFDCTAGVADPVQLVVSLAFTFGIGFLLSHFGLYGGADVKALILIASAFPSYPPGMQIPLWKIIPLPALAVIFIAVLFSAAYPISIFTSNLMAMLGGDDPLEGLDEKSPFKRLLLLMTARRVPIKELAGLLKYFPAERIVMEGDTLRRKPILFVHAEADVDRMVEELMKHKELYKDGVLASPTIPMVALLEAASILLSILLFL
jgi:Flp pilus assembly protein protease CpaA